MAEGAHSDERRKNLSVWSFFVVACIAIAGQLSSDSVVEAAAFLPFALLLAVDSVANFRARWQRPTEAPEQLKGVSRTWWRDHERAMLPMAVFCPSAFLVIAIFVLAEATVGADTQPFQIAMFFPAIVCVSSAFIGIATWWLGEPEALVPPALRGRGPAWSRTERSDD